MLKESCVRETLSDDFEEAAEKWGDTETSNSAKQRSAPEETSGTPGRDDGMNQSGRLQRQVFRGNTNPSLVKTLIKTSPVMCLKRPEIEMKIQA